jgi:hypothetical protein
MKRTILKIILVPGLPIGTYYFFYGLGMLAKIIGFNAKSPHITLEGLCLFIAVVFIGGITALIIWGLWNLAEKVLEFFELEISLRRRRRLQREPDPEESYLMRIGVRRE